MTQESFPRNADGDIVDETGYSIVKASQDTVEENRKLAKAKRAHELEVAALHGAKEVKLQAVTDLDRPEDRAGPETAEYYRQRGELLEDAASLSESATTAEIHAYHHSFAIKESNEEAATHVDENLPAYIQAATEMANVQLEPRAGQKAAVTSRQEGLVGFTEVTPVDPARSNQDVNHPQTTS